MLWASGFNLGLGVQGLGLRGIEFRLLPTKLQLCRRLQDSFTSA